MASTHEVNFNADEGVLAVSLELAKGSWKVALQDGKHARPAVHTVSNPVAAGRLSDTVKVIEDVRRAWGMAAQPVALVYEAGQDGFWIARALRRQGYAVMVVDPASIPVERRARRAKTDRLDALMLVNALRGWLRGERDRMRVVHEPDETEEAQRHLARDRGELQKEVQQHRDRLRKLLRTVGCWEEIDAAFAQRLARGTVVCHDGTALPAELTMRLERELARLALVQQQFAGLEKALVPALPAPAQETVKRLARLRGVGAVGAMRLTLELFWRRFDNRREVGACIGLVPQPYDSGESHADQGISKQGNRRVRALLIEMAWDWLRYQPTSALAQWFAQRTQGSGASKRGKRIAIVAVARRLAIALWRYLKDGVVPAGARLKAA